MRMARADKTITKPQNDPDRNPQRRQQPGAQGAGKERDALGVGGEIDQQKLKDNQEQLQVDRDHKTTDMRKKQRGSFP
jgi:hypothetical protein